MVLGLLDVVVPNSYLGREARVRLRGDIEGPVEPRRSAVLRFDDAKGRGRRSTATRGASYRPRPSRGFELDGRTHDLRAIGRWRGGRGNAHTGPEPDLANGRGMDMLARVLRINETKTDKSLALPYRVKARTR